MLERYRIETIARMPALAIRWTDGQNCCVVCVSFRDLYAAAVYFQLARLTAHDLFDVDNTECVRSMQCMRLMYLMTATPVCVA